MEKSLLASSSVIKDLTTGSVLKNLIRFSLPFLLSCFLQTFYGLADLFIISRYYCSAVISAVAIGSQIMHMVTVIITGLAMGTTVSISRAVGLQDSKKLRKNIGSSVSFFAIFSFVLMIILVLFSSVFLRLLKTPEEAFSSALKYCFICFLGVPFITSYNILSNIYRGVGDSKSPMYFILIAGVFNIVLDFVFIGYFSMGSAGAAFATILSQCFSVLIALSILYLKCRRNNKKELETEEEIKKRRRLKMIHMKEIKHLEKFLDENGIKQLREKERNCNVLDVHLTKKDFILDRDIINNILKIGIPVAIQDGIIQISFLIITSIANSRGVEVAAAVGIVEKIICFLFLVPSAMLSSVSAISAQNIGAGNDKRAFHTLEYAIIICVTFGIIVSVICNVWAKQIVSIFAKNDKMVVILASQYLRSYIIDCIVAGIHFCFSGFFCAYGKSIYSFFHNILSVILIRIPLSYLASVFYPGTLFPMGMAAPLGSLFSSCVCVLLFFRWKKENGK